LSKKRATPITRRSNSHPKRNESRGRIRCSPVIFCFLSAIKFSLCAAADEDSISTDRPDVVDSSDVVAAGVLQLEVGANYQRNDNVDPRTRTVTTPMLIRYGIGSDFELRLGTDGHVTQETHGADGESTDRGYADLSLGFKWHISDGAVSTHRPAIAIELNTEVPSGSGTFKGAGALPSLRAIAEWEISDSASIGVMSGAVFNRSATHRFWSGILATSADASITETMHGFVEIAGQQFAHADDGNVLATLDTGLTYLLSNSIQLDCAIFRGINHSTPNWNFGAGISVRW